MGREIRKVPANWKHPRKDSGSYWPMHNHHYKAEAERWEREYKQWLEGKHESQSSSCNYFWEYDSPPDEMYCLPEFNGEPTHIQIYETVSEGTPVSPVFADKSEMIEWLVGEGYSREAAEGFAKSEWTMSGIFSATTGFVKDIEACASFKDSK